MKNTCRGKCKVCKRKLTNKDYYKLCRKCQPAYSMGMKDEKDYILSQLSGTIEELKGG